MTNYIFDLYGTQIDIHTRESKASLWKEVAMLFSKNVFVRFRCICGKNTCVLGMCEKTHGLS